MKYRPLLQIFNEWRVKSVKVANNYDSYVTLNIFKM